MASVTTAAQLPGPPQMAAVTAVGTCRAWGSGAPGRREMCCAGVRWGGQWIPPSLTRPGVSADLYFLYVLEIQFWWLGEHLRAGAGRA